MLVQHSASLPAQLLQPLGKQQCPLRHWLVQQCSGAEHGSPVGCPHFPVIGQQLPEQHATDPDPQFVPNGAQHVVPHSQLPSHMWTLPLEHPSVVSVLGAHPSPTQSPGASHWQSAPHSVVRVPVLQLPQLSTVDTPCAQTPSPVHASGGAHMQSSVQVRV